MSFHIHFFQQQQLKMFFFILQDINVRIRHPEIRKNPNKMNDINILWESASMKST